MSEGMIVKGQAIDWVTTYNLFLINIDFWYIFQYEIGQ